VKALSARSRARDAGDQNRVVIDHRVEPPLFLVDLETDLRPDAPLV
jgi:hypothetical protein